MEEEPADDMGARDIGPYTFEEKLELLVNRLEDVLDLMQSTPETIGSIHRVLFRPDKRSFQHDEYASGSPGEECIICKEPFISTVEPRPDEHISVKETCDHLVLDAHHGCWVCKVKSFVTFLEEKQPASEPGECHAIRLKPYGHIVGDACFDMWMSNPKNSEASLCPYCQQPLQATSKGVIKAAKHYLSSSLISHLPDLVLCDVRILRAKPLAQWVHAQQRPHLFGLVIALVLLLVWVGWFLYMLTIIVFSSWTVKAKVELSLQAAAFLLEPVIYVIIWNLLRGILQLVVYVLEAWSEW